MSKIFSTRHHYKPISYPWAMEGYEKQQAVLWFPEEVPLAEDVKDWNKKLSSQEKNLLTQIFRFFTQADVDVAGGYYKNYLPTFHLPELRMMMGSFANMESTHIKAYSLLLDTVGMPEDSYKAFMEYEDMKAKHEYLLSTDIPYHPSILEVAKSIAVYSAFGEGLQLFSSFAILMNFPRFGKMKGMGTIVDWSMRDESIHVEYMIKVFRQIIKENKDIWTDEFKKELYLAGMAMVELEFRFIDLAFARGGVEGLEPEEVKEYVKYIADRRFLQLGLKPQYGVKHHPLPWLAEMLSAPEHANFFENRVTDYTQGTLQGDWSKDVWK